MSVDGEETWIKIMPDQVHLLLGSWGQGPTHILDIGSLQSIANLKQWDVSVTRGKNGQQIILASQPGHSITRLAVLDPVTFDILRSWSLPTSYASWISPP